PRAETSGSARPYQSETKTGHTGRNVTMLRSDCVNASLPEVLRAIHRRSARPIRRQARGHAACSTSSPSSTPPPPTRSTATCWSTTSSARSSPARPVRRATTAAPSSPDAPRGQTPGTGDSHTAPRPSRQALRPPPRISGAGAEVFRHLSGAGPHGSAVVAEAVVVQRHRGAGGGTEAVRAVVGVVVGRHRVRRVAGLFGGLHLDVAVAVDTGTGRDQLADDHVLL